jgi:ABC-type Fe3+-hydroxamate transport system substrate-binding protein
MILSADDIFNRKKYSCIVSLVPSQTELLYYLGLNDETIGITKFCIHPSNWFQNKIRVGGTKNIHFDAIDQLSPDLIIANKEENVKEQVEALSEKYDVWVTNVNDLEDAIDMIKDIGKLTGKEQRATVLCEKIKESFRDLEEKITTKPKIKTAYFIWKNPYMVVAGNTFINDMMNYCGYENVFSDQKRYPQITLEDLIEKNCKLILLSSEPYPFKEKHKEEIEKQIPGIQIKLVDGEMFSWYGSRLLKSAAYFEKLIS